MEEKVLEILSKDENALTVPEIETQLGLDSIEELKELLKVLHTLEEEYKVYRTKKDKYMLFNNSNLKTGKLLATKKGYGLWYNVDEIPVTGIRASGVKSISLKDDEVVSGLLFNAVNEYISIIRFILIKETLIATN